MEVYLYSNLVMIPRRPSRVVGHLSLSVVGGIFHALSVICPKEVYRIVYSRHDSVGTSTVRHFESHFAKP